MFWTRSIRLFRSPRVFLSHCHSRKFCSFSQDNDPGSWESMEGLSRCSANFVPLSPITFLERAAKVCRDRTSVVYGSLEYNWGETHQRCLKLASALTHLGISRGDVVSLVFAHTLSFFWFYWGDASACFLTNELWNIFYKIMDRFMTKLTVDILLFYYSDLEYLNLFSFLLFFSYKFA